MPTNHEGERLTVTAQDFIKAIVTDKYGQFNSWEETRKNFDALLSRSREKTIEECLNTIGRPMLTPMDDFATQYRVVSQQIVYDKIAKLKSTTN